MEIHDLNTKALTDPAYVAFDDGTDTYKTEFNDCVESAANAAVAAADLTQNDVVFTSGDAASPTAWSSVSVLTSGSTLATLFNRISTMVKNVRYLWNLIGSSSFSNVASTLSGAIGNTALTTTAQTLSGAIAEHESDISTLNGKTILTLTRTENTHVTVQNFNRLSAYKRGNVLCLNGNLSAEYGSGFTDFNEIGRISNWSAISDIYVNVPAQNDGSKVICIQIYANGTIRIYSSTAFSGAPFFRFCVSVPCA